MASNVYIEQALKRSFSRVEGIVGSVMVLDISETTLRENASFEKYDLDSSRLKTIMYRKDCSSPFLKRELVRYDFTDEWNNLGYGRISDFHPDFDISEKIKIDISDELLAWIEIEGDRKVIPFIWSDGSKIWVNRKAANVDGLDWHVIERFVAEKADLPIVLEVPHGYKHAITMRIDCDEDIKSGKRLFELYKSKGIPFSLALKTDLEMTSEDMKLIKDVLMDGGSVVSHSHTHKPYWGGSYEEAYEDAKKAIEVISELGGDPNYVVSPFHQNPTFSVEAIRDAGHLGFVAGIIHNDPEYLCARSGVVPFVEGIFTHSQQCMFHGDCYHETGLEVYKQTFDNHYKTGTFFGYLDHPFSDYLYGWDSEEERVKVHSEFIDFMKTYDGVWYASLSDAMDFLYDRYRTEVYIEDGELKWELPQNRRSDKTIQVMWKNRLIPLE